MSVQKRWPNATKRPWRVKTVPAPALPAGEASYVYSAHECVTLALPEPDAALIVHAVNLLAPLEAVAEVAQRPGIKLAVEWLAYFCDEGPQPEAPVFDAVADLGELFATLAALAAARERQP